MTIEKPTFAALPARCIGDERVAALDIRVLAAIAMHDRFSKNGVGCTIGHGKLAVKLNCHLKSLSRSLRTLAECGYIGGRDNPLNPKYRAYFVIYNELDEGFSKAPTGNQLVTPTGSETVTSIGSRGNQLATQSAARGNQLLENAEQIQEDVPYNILGEAYNRSREAVLRNPVETAPVGAKGAFEREPSGSVGAMLAMIERNMKAGMTKPSAEKWHRWLEQQISDGGLDYSSSEYQRAFRLWEEMGGLLDAA